MYIILYDIWFYFSHIILHYKWMYKYHKQHHMNVFPTWLDTSDSSVVENILQSIGLFLGPLYYQKLTTDFVIASGLISVRGLMRHDDRCTFLIGNHHLLHHQYLSYNFGEYWLDYIFGTMYPNYAEHKRGFIFFL